MRSKTSLSGIPIGPAENVPLSETGHHNGILKTLRFSLNLYFHITLTTHYHVHPPQPPAPNPLDKSWLSVKRIVHNGNFMGIIF